MNASINTTMGLKQWLMLVTLSILWGGSFFFVAVALEALPALSIVALRVLFAAVSLWGVVWLIKLKIPKDPQLWLGFLVMGLLNNAIPFTLITWGQIQVASGLAAIFNAAVPLFTVVVAALLLPDEKVTPLKALGVVTGFIGVSIMLGFPSISESGYVIAQLAILVAGLSYAFAAVYGRRFKAQGINPMMLATGQLSVSSLIMLPIAFGVDGVISADQVATTSMLAVLALAVLSTALAYILYFKVLADAGAINASLVTLLIPVSAILLGVSILGETLEWVHIVGMGLIALGLLIIDGRLWQLIKR